MTVNKGGRPKKEFDKELFENLCALFCTKDDICGVFDCDEKTLTRWCHDTYGMGFSDIRKRKATKGKVSLRRAQYKKAMAGNTSMLIFLGKNYLDQSDKTETELTGKDGGAIEFESPADEIRRRITSIAARQREDEDIK